MFLIHADHLKYQIHISNNGYIVSKLAQVFVFQRPHLKQNMPCRQKHMSTLILTYLK